MENLNNLKPSKKPPFNVKIASQYYIHDLVIRNDQQGINLMAGNMTKDIKNLRRNVLSKKKFWKFPKNFGERIDLINSEANKQDVIILQEKPFATSNRITQIPSTSQRLENTKIRLYCKNIANKEKSNPKKLSILYYNSEAPTASNIVKSTFLSKNTYVTVLSPNKESVKNNQRFIFRNSFTNLANLSSKEWNFILQYFSENPKSISSKKKLNSLYPINDNSLEYLKKYSNSNIIPINESKPLSLYEKRNLFEEGKLLSDKIIRRANNFGNNSIIGIQKKPISSLEYSISKKSKEILNCSKKLVTFSKEKNSSNKIDTALSFDQENLLKNDNYNFGNNNIKNILENQQILNNDDVKQNILIPRSFSLFNIKQKFGKNVAFGKSIKQITPIQEENESFRLRGPTQNFCNFLPKRGITKYKTPINDAEKFYHQLYRLSATYKNDLFQQGYYEKKQPKNEISEQENRKRIIKNAQKIFSYSRNNLLKNKFKFTEKLYKTLNSVNSRIISSTKNYLSSWKKKHSEQIVNIDRLISRTFYQRGKKAIFGGF